MTSSVAGSDLEARSEVSGLWSEVFAGDFAGRPALFLDRDGVIVEDTHYLGRPEEMRMLAGAAAAIAQCNRLGIPVVLVSNQSGIARGLYDWKGFAAVQAALADALTSAGARLDARLCLCASRRRTGAVQHCRSSLAQAEPGHDCRCRRADEA